MCGHNMECQTGTLLGKTVKPLFAIKSDNVMNEIILMEYNVIKNDHVTVSNIMNEYYVIITRYIGNDDSHQSIISFMI